MRLSNRPCIARLGQWCTLHRIQPYRSISNLVLNFDHDINTPGDYRVEAKHSGRRNPTQRDVQAKLNFRVEQDTIPPSQLQPWLDGLRSDDRSIRYEAARTLASVAPPSLEETLLGFINNPEFRKYAALAFHRLNSPRSMDAMAELMQGPVTGEQIEAAQYLALSDNQR
jgi:hypothetical protein